MTRYLTPIPLTLIPLVVYLIVTFSTPAVPGIWDEIVFTLNMISGGKFTMLYEHLLLSFSLIFLFIEIVKSTRQTTQELYDHILSMVTFIIYLVLFLTVARCAHGLFFLLTLIALIDVVAGFLVTISAGRRSLQVESGATHL